MAYYNRQIGYTPNFQKTWETMKAWVYANNIDKYERIAIFHDDPTITALDQCHYVACIIPDHPLEDTDSNNLPQLEIQKCLCVTFEYEGSQEDILTLIQWVNQKCLPTSMYEKITIPSYMIFHNKLNSVDDQVKGTYCILVKFIG